MDKPLCIDLFCGLGGWSEGFLSEGWECIGFDIEKHDYGSGGYPGQLVLQDVLSLHGSQFRNADCIVASPPCQNYSYMAMPWKRAKAMAVEIRQDAAKIAELNALFNACFRLQLEASQAAGHHVPMVVENVCGAQRWVGQSVGHFGSYYLWGDVPAIMPFTLIGEGSKGFVTGLGMGHDWRQDPSAQFNSKSTARKVASAQIAKIPFELASYIARVFKPDSQMQAVG